MSLCGPSRRYVSCTCSLQYINNGNYSIEVTYTIVDDSGCTQTLSIQENFDHTGCGCSCDISTLSLGPISYLQFPNDCATYFISVPTITGCANVEMYDTYNFKVYDITSPYF